MPNTHQASSNAPRLPRGFLPPDPRTEEPYRLTPQLAFRVAVLGFLALTVFGVLFLRLWALQVLSGDRYLAQANNNRVRTLKLEAPRGPILDRNGHVIVTNVPGTRIELWPADLPKTWNERLAELKALSAVTGVPVRDVLARLKEHGDDPLTPVVVQSGIHSDQVDYLSEHRAQFPGVRLADSWFRKYPYQSLLAQTLGYVGQISPDQVARLRKQGYAAGDSVGQAGIESEYDTYLRGRDGKAQLTVDALGRPTSQVQPEVNPRPGEALRLTIDIGLQRAAERALTYGIKVARASGAAGAYADGGAIVALDPRDGSILAMASNPTYQPSVWSGRKDLTKPAPLLDAPVAKKDNYPALNRATQVTYPPGSTFKPVTALAAMQEGLLNPFDFHPCTPTYTSHGQQFDNWTPLIDQGMNLETAIAESCDTFFYPLGDAFYNLPPNRGHPLQAWADRFGLGVATGVDLPGEVNGLIPTPEWRRSAFPASRGYTELDRTWKPGYSIQLTIGQGDVLVTPLQMARFYAMIANGGKLVTPHIAGDVELTSGAGRSGSVLRRFGAQTPRATGVDPGALRVVQQGLYQAAHSPLGTSYGVFGNFPLAIAGKTGTAEKFTSLPGYPHPLKLNQSWWCGYGPYDNPTIVVCAVIENGGHGGTAAAPAALKVFEQWFGRTATTSQHASD